MALDAEKNQPEEHHASGNLMDSVTSHLDDILKEKLEKAFHEDTSELIPHAISKIVSEHSPIDLAYAAFHLPPSERFILYDNLSDLEAKETFLVNTDSRTRIAVLWHLDDKEIKSLIEQAPSEDAANILEALSERRYRRVIDLIAPPKRQRIQEILQHSINTAGRIMTNEFFAFHRDVTIGEAAQIIRNNPGIDLTREVYVVDDKQDLQGYVPGRNLIINADNLALRQVMRPVIHKVSVDATREEVVDVVERYKIATLPVCDEEDRLIGVISYEDVIEVIEDIADETIARMAGTTEDVGEHEPLPKRFFSRAPWLLVALCAGIINGMVMSTFRNLVGDSLVFVLFFVPLITGLSGNIGLQSSTVLVRSMATGVLSAGTKGEAVFKEIILGGLNALIFGLITGVTVFALDSFGIANLAIQPLAVGVIVGVGLFGACVAGTLLGVYSPLFFVRIGIDPAIASGPIITSFNDFFAMSIYFLISLGLGALFF